MKVIAQQGDTLDMLCQRHIGRTAGVTEQALALNPGLAAMGPVLEMGTSVTLPEIEAAVQPEKSLTQLWD